MFTTPTDDDYQAWTREVNAKGGDGEKLLRVRALIASHER